MLFSKLPLVSYVLGARVEGHDENNFESLAKSML